MCECYCFNVGPFDLHIVHCQVLIVVGRFSSAVLPLPEGRGSAFYSSLSVYIIIS